MKGRAESGMDSQEPRYPLLSPGEEHFSQSLGSLPVPQKKALGCAVAVLWGGVGGAFSFFLLYYLVYKSISITFS